MVRHPPSYQSRLRVFLPFNLALNLHDLAFKRLASSVSAAHTSVINCGVTNSPTVDPAISSHAPFRAVYAEAA